jgi:mRNA interferase MazF
MKKKTSTKRNPKRHDIWLVRFPFSDLASSKVRPALVLAIHREDVIVAGIFSRVPSSPLAKTWVRVEDGGSHFRRTGLKKTSVVKTEKLAAVHQSVFVRRLGTLAPPLAASVELALKIALHLDCPGPS